MESSVLQSMLRIWRNIRRESMPDEQDATVAETELEAMRKHGHPNHPDHPDRPDHPHHPHGGGDDGDDDGKGQIGTLERSGNKSKRGLRPTIPLVGKASTERKRHAEYRPAHARRP